MEIKETNGDYYTITNTQYYMSLTPKITYKMTCYLAYEDSSPVLDKYGNRIETEVVFVPENSSGKVDIVLNVNKEYVKPRTAYKLMSNIELVSTTEEIMETGFGIPTPVMNGIGIGIFVAIIIAIVGTILYSRKKPAKESEEEIIEVPYDDIDFLG